MPFLQLAAEKKTPFLEQVKQFWPFLFCDGFRLDKMGFLDPASDPGLQKPQNLAFLVNF